MPAFVTADTGSRHLAGLVSFVVDTGAASTVLGYGDRMKLGFSDGHQFEDYAIRTGIGGQAVYGVVNATVVFFGSRGAEGSIVPLPVSLLVSTDRRDNFTLLGRDLLYEFRLMVENGLVELEYLELQPPLSPPVGA